MRRRPALSVLAVLLACAEPASAQDASTPPQPAALAVPLPTPKPARPVRAAPPPAANAGANEPAAPDPFFVAPDVIAPPAYAEEPSPPARQTPVEPVPPAVAAASYGSELEGFDYPFPVQTFEFTSQDLPLHMTYMDVAPSGAANGRTVVLLHGKSFCAATWAHAIRTLADAGYRVVAPDQVGFCKSTKPLGYQFSFAQLAENTHALLASLDVGRTSVVGHSMGGMLAARYALMYPRETDDLVLVNPLGLENWGAKGVPYQSVDEAFRTELKTDAQSIKAYQQKYYYGGAWRPDYDTWVMMAAGAYRGAGRDAVAWSQALTADMVFTQPVVTEFPRIDVPTTLIIGQLDRTAPGADRAPKAVAAKLGDYPKLGRAAARLIPRAKLVEFPRLGHAPQIQDPDAFEAALLASLAGAAR